MSVSAATSNGPTPAGVAAPVTAFTRVSMPPMLREYCWIILGLSVISTVCCLIMFLLHKPYPYDWPFFIPEIRFSDLTLYPDKFAHFHEAAFFSTGMIFNYAALMTLVYEFFFKVGGSHVLGLFLAVMALGFTVPAVLFFRALVRRGLSTLAALALAGLSLVLSWPALLVFDRANVEVFVFIVLCIGAWAYSRRKENLAASMFAVAAALKFFPFILLALFFTRRKYPKIVLAAAVFAAITVVSLAVLGPTISYAYHGLAKDMATFKQEYMSTYRPSEGGVDHSILSLVKTVVAASLRHHSEHAIGIATRIDLAASVVFGLLLYFLRIRKLPWLNQFLSLTIASIWLTPFSGDGTLLHLYSSLVMCSFLAIDAWRRGLEIPGLRAVFRLLAFLVTTESFFVFVSRRFEGQFKCVALGILLYYALRYPLSAPLEASADEELAWPDASRVASARAFDYAA